MVATQGEEEVVATQGEEWKVTKEERELMEAEVMVVHFPQTHTSTVQTLPKCLQGRLVQPGAIPLLCPCEIQEMC